MVSPKYKSEYTEDEKHFWNANFRICLQCTLMQELETIIESQNQSKCKEQTCKLVVSCSNWHTYNTTPTSKAQGHSKEGQ